MSYIIYNEAGEILRVVQCSPAMSKIQPKEGEFIMEGTANGVTQKIKFDGLDVNDQPINPRVVNKTKEEIKRENPTIPKVPKSQKPAYITNKQWQDVLKRIDKLETR